LVVAAAPFVTTAQILRDGDFDSLPIGSAPNVSSPAGAWFFPFGWHESHDTEVTIVRAPGQPETDHCLRVSTAGAESFHLVNVFTRPLQQSVDTIILVSFDVYVPAATVGGPAIYLANEGVGSDLDRGPQLMWGAGTLFAYSIGLLETPLVSSYPRNAWQSVRMEIDLVSDTYSVFWGVRGSPLEHIGSGLGFRSGPQRQLDRFAIARFINYNQEIDAFVDNVRVTEVPRNNPSLSLHFTGDSIILSWTAAAAAYQMESTATLDPGAVWAEVSTPEVVLGHENVVTVHHGDGAQFFRLRKR
jgi:hypothetical protein